MTRTLKSAVVSLLFYCLLLHLIIQCGSNKPEEDLYKLLGVPRTATTKEIKSAYRRRALDTHPDKNPDVDPEEAAAKFHDVVRAFEVLSDENSRRIYDRTGRHHDGQQGNGRNQQPQRRSHSSTFTVRFTQRKPTELKDRPHVKEAMSRAMNVVSLTQLETIMLDDDDRAERNLLMCFYTPSLEKLVGESMVFPYPFAGMSPQKIWWEDILQTVKVRFHRGNDLTRKFNIPSGEDLAASGKAVFIFVKRGNTFDNFETISSNNRAEFEDWMWKRISLEVRFRNNHNVPVDLYWIHETSAKNNGRIGPGETVQIQSFLGHEFFVQSTDVDNFEGAPRHKKLTVDSGLGNFKILSDENSQLIEIMTVCHDLSGYCAQWASRGECDRNPSFMHSKCTKTCKVCPAIEGGENKTGHDEL